MLKYLSSAVETFGESAHIRKRWSQLRVVFSVRVVFSYLNVCVCVCVCVYSEGGQDNESQSDRWNDVHVVFFMLDIRLVKLGSPER